MSAPPDPRSTRQHLLDLLLDVVGASLAVLGASLVLHESSSGLVRLVLALLVLLASLLVGRRRPGPPWRPLGAALVLRTALLAGTTVAVATSGSGAGDAPTQERVVACGALAVLMGCLVAEPLVARAARFQVPVAVRLPGLSAAPRFRDLGPHAVLASSAATAAGLLVAALGASAWWWLLAAALAAAPMGVLVVSGTIKIVWARRLRARVPEAMAAYAPDFVVYTSRPDDASYQVLMWLPYLQRAGLRFVVVARNATPAAALAAQTDVPVVEARRMSDLEGLVVPSLKAAFYVNASSGNGALVRFQHLTHIYLGHGDSDKPPSYNPTHAMYDQVFAAGPAATRRYASHGVRVPAEKFRIVGRPQVEDVLPATGPIGSVAEPVVLYAPTWRGHVEETMLSSLPRGETIVAALLGRGVRLIFRPHPFSYDFEDDAGVIRRIHALLAADTQRTGRQHVWGAEAESGRGILDCINESDAMVSDVSSVVSDYLYSGKPFAMVAVGTAPAAFVAEYPVAAASYVVGGDLADLPLQLTQLLGDDPHAERRRALRADYLGDFPVGNYADAFTEAVRRVTRQPRPDQAPDDRETLPGEDRIQESENEQAPHEDGTSTQPEDATVGASGRLAGLGRHRPQLTRWGLGLAGAGLSLVALATALLAAPPWVTAGAALLASGAALQPVLGHSEGTSLGGRLLHAGATTRAVLLVALAVLATRPEAPAWPAGPGLLALGAALAAERSVQAAWRSFGLNAVNLPAAVQPVREVVPRDVLPLAAAGVTVLAFLGFAGAGAGVLSTSVPAVVLALGGAVVLGLAVLAVDRALRRASRVALSEQLLRPALVRHAPEFAVYFASNAGAGYQLGMWLPYFARIGRPFVIVTRSVAMMQQAALLCERQGLAVPVVHRPTLRSLEDVLVPSLVAAFYVNNAVRNTHLIERRELTHVWLNHGDSEKPACYNPVHAVYDLIFAAGRAGIDRYARHGVTIPREKFVLVGRPQVERIESARGPIAERPEPTVLYAPTWQGPYADSRVSSLFLGAAVVQQLLDRGTRVVFRAHPFNYRYAECRTAIASIQALLDRDRDRTGREHLWGPAAEQELSVEACFNLSDAMICDVSAVVSDYLRSDKPFSIVSVGRSREQLLLDVPAAAAGYVVQEDLTNLPAVLDDLLGADPLARARSDTRIYHLGDVPAGRDAEGFLTAARALLGADRPAGTLAAAGPPATATALRAAPAG